MITSPQFLAYQRRRRLEQHLAELERQVNVLQGQLARLSAVPNVPPVAAELAEGLHWATLTLLADAQENPHPMAPAQISIEPAFQPWVWSQLEATCETLEQYLNGLILEDYLEAMLDC